MPGRRLGHGSQSGRPGQRRHARIMSSLSHGLTNTSRATRTGKGARTTSARVRAYSSLPLPAMRLIRLPPGPRSANAKATAISAPRSGPTT